MNKSFKQKLKDLVYYILSINTYYVRIKVFIIVELNLYNAESILQL